MDEAAIERQGLAPLAAWLKRLDSLQRQDLPALLGELSRLQLDLPLQLSVATDTKDVRRHTLWVQQGGLGLPDRDDYAASDERSRRLQAAYRAYAAQLLGAAGAPADAGTIDALMAFEARIAQATMTRVQRRDPQATYNRLDLAALQSRAPGFDWTAWQRAYTGQDTARSMIVANPAVADTLAALAQDAPLEHWRSYLRLRLLDATAEKLPRALAQAHFDYRSGAIRGLKTEPPRVERVILAIGGATGGQPLGESLGQLFVAKTFTPAAQARALAMVDDIRSAMRTRVQALPWMGDATRAQALAKLEQMVAQIGAPAQWRSYEGLVLRPDDYAGNQLRTSAWFTASRLAELDAPVDRLRWNTSPHIVNAFAAGGNRIVFPAGILQPPFFDAGADDASNYGAIGMVIGHEITHHFDDRGRQFEALGHLRDWWTAADAAAYRQRAERVAALYSGYEPLPGMRINGQQMLGENISDLGGLQIAYDGLQIALQRQRQAGQPLPLIDGRTPEQRFFIANAVVWRNKARAEHIANQLRTGQHSPGRYRVLGPMSNSPAFAQAFGCKAGDAMVALDPIRIW